MRVLMYPKMSIFDNHESGIKRVIEAYYKYAQEYGIEFVDCDVTNSEQYDVFAVHAGMTNIYPKDRPIVSHCHGLYWTADYQASIWEWKANSNVITALRAATVITVPSNWVAESIRRDMRIDPVILPHGIDVESFVNVNKNDGFVLWNKNRNMDVCNPHYIGVLASKNPSIEFVTTFGPSGVNLENIHIIGLQDAASMKRYIHGASVYLSTTKETFGIGILEALASGVPVLGFDYGGNKEIVQHCVDGYLAEPNNTDDLSEGLAYCMKYREVLSRNAVRLSKEWSWKNPMEILKKTYEMALEKYENGKRSFTLPESLYSL